MACLRLERQETLTWSMLSMEDGLAKAGLIQTRALIIRGVGKGVLLYCQRWRER